MKVASLGGEVVQQLLYENAWVQSREVFFKLFFLSNFILWMADKCIAQNFTFKPAPWVLVGSLNSNLHACAGLKVKILDNRKLIELIANSQLSSMCNMHKKDQEIGCIYFN